MATIETAEGDTLIVEQRSSRPSLYAKVSYTVENGTTITQKHEERVSRLYARTAIKDKPWSRGDLTVGVMQQIVDLVVGRIVITGETSRRSNVNIERIEVDERDKASKARRPITPNHIEGWPEEGSMTEKVKFMLNECPMYTNEEIAIAADCSRSLVSDVKASHE